ncbi:hypothetical protein T492DRAFT_193809 [Pavlovales sp. CCMP2436]|nr:hypothetical protein T492DRAFT_193809 [Pavlovales sp. CCMP2436]
MAAAITPWSYLRQEGCTYPERSDDIAVITTARISTERGAHTKSAQRVAKALGPRCGLLGVAFSAVGSGCGRPHAPSDAPSSRSSSIECSPLSPRSERWCGRSPRSERWCGRARGSSASSGSSCVAAGSSAIAEPSTSRSPTEFSPVSPRSERWWSGMPRGGGDPFASSCSRCVAAGSSTVAEPSSLRLSSRSSSMEFSPVLPRSERWCVLRGGVEPTGGTLAFSCCVAAGSSTICRGARRLALSETRRWTGCQCLVVGGIPAVSRLCESIKSVSGPPTNRVRGPVHPSGSLRPKANFGARF